MKKTPKRIWLLIIFSLVGAVVSWIQTTHFYDLHAGATGFKSFCNVGKSFNCDVIESSPYAVLFGGIPLSAFAGGWFLGLTLVGLFALSSDWRKSAVRTATGMSFVGAILSVVYLIIMMTIIKSYCMLCLVVDGLNFVSLGIGLSLWASASAMNTHSLFESGHWKTLFGIIAATLFASFVFAKSLDIEKLTPTTIDEMYASVMNSNPVPVGAGDEYASIGPKDAPITIVKFSDFQCPACKLGALTLHPILQRYADKIHFVFRNFPLDPSCNRTVQHSMHPVACEAARVGYCASKQGLFQPVYEALFEKQATFAPGKPEEIAVEAGANAAILKACVNAPETASAIAKDVEEGDRLGVRSTPTFFINGLKNEGALPIEVWSKVIDHLLTQTAAHP